MELGGEKYPTRHRCRRCALTSVAIILCIALLLVILGLTVFRIRSATTTVNAVNLNGLHAGIDIFHLNVDLNVTLDIDLTAHNPNVASFRYGEGSAELFYRGAQIGEAGIPPGEIDAGGSVRMNVTVTIFTDRLIGDPAAYTDLLAGSMVFQTSTMIPGRVTLLGFLKHDVVTYSSCDLTVDVGSRTVDHSECRYRTKI
ncbi:hypothetical protein AXF42_Ash004464 [Apostasia shenzhenica]|uniref:Late embryogenesis abundant protein LEA-2 subgroup domain-containing protein n=1 Tax=Apostasia shenzhenica TaxID=1088818 RepID=A0A2I0BGT1_9ASPA|nr:hypothetical protein AXF42_Ash004464 [Apostasia shenzhenica]